MPADPQRIQSIFLVAIEAADPTARAALLARECGDDAELRQRVEVLLQAHDQSGSFLDKPAVEPMTTDEPAGQWINPDAPLTVTEQPGMRVGRYKLLQKIGEGGMGVVYMAEQQEPVRRMVALKIIKPGMDSDAVVARFEAERQALALMDHQNIARVFDGGTTESGRPFFVMELVKGIPITRFCDENRLTPRERLELFVSVCEAVQHAHQKGVIHRDLKPSNVLVTLYDGKPVPKVIDFGVAKALHQKLTERTMFTAFGTVVGTLEYMSPEQAEMNALDVDTRSDVYSLGVLLYELLTGTTPLERERLRKAAYTEMLRLIREEEPLRPSMRISDSGQALARISSQRQMEPAQLARLVRGELDWIVMKSLEKDRSRRYETATGLARDVERYLKDEPVEACPPSVAYRLGKFARKNRVALSTVAAFAALLLIASGVSTWLAVVATGAKQYADEKREDAEVAQKEANDERNRANREAAQAKANAAETGRALDRMMVAKGIQLAEEGRFFTALQYFIKPLERGGLAPEEEEIHRTRIACYLRYTPGRPRLRHIFFCEKPFGPPYNSRLRFSADGKRLLAVTGDVVHLWDLPSGNLLGTLKHPSGVWTAQFSPDSAHVLTTTYGSDYARAAVWTWDAAMVRPLGSPVVDWGGLLQRPMSLLPISPWQSLVSVGAKGWEDRNVDTPDPDTYKGIADDSEISQDCHRALFTFRTVGLRLFDLQTHKLIGQWRDTGPHALSPDGRTLLQADGNLVRIRDTSAGKAAPRSIDHGSFVLCITFSPDGNRALTVERAGRGRQFARVWDTRTWQPLTSLYDPGPEKLYLLWAFSPDNRLILGSDTNRLAWWDVESGRLIRESSARGGPGAMTEFDWRQDGQQVLHVSHLSSGEVALWDAASGWRQGLVLPQFGAEEVAYAPDGRTLAMAGDGVVRIWDLCDREDTLSWQAPAKDDLNPDIRLRDRIARGSWSAPTGSPYEVKSLDKSRLITVHHDQYKTPNNLKLWDVRSKRSVGKPLESKGAYTCVVFSPDSRLFATASADCGGDALGEAQIYNARTGELVGKPLKHEGSVYFVAFSPDSDLCITCSQDGTARLWRTKTGEPVGENLRHGDSVTRAAFSPNGKMVATASLDGTVRLWNVGSGTAEGVLELKNGVAWDLVFHPNGSLLMVFFGEGYLFVGRKNHIKIFDTTSLLETFPAVKGIGSEHGSDRLGFRLRKDGRFAFGFFDRRSWNMTPDNRPASDLAKLGQLYSGQRLNAVGGLSPLSQQELQALWQELHAKYPEEFVVSPKAAVEWRIEQFQSASTVDQADLVAFHRRWLAAELAAADELAGRWSKDAGTLYSCACVYALAAGAVKTDAAMTERYAARAVALLQQAIKAGYNDGQHIGKDADLDALRQRDDFQKLLKKLNAKQP